jgi:hypothetical protein
MQILRVSDTVTLKSGEIEVDINPLNYSQNIEVSNCLKIVAGKEVSDANKQTELLIKYAIKEVRGAKSFDGSSFVIKREGSELNIEQITDAISILMKTKLIGHLSTVAYTASVKEMKDVKLLVNGKEVDFEKKD